MRTYLNFARACLAVTVACLPGTALAQTKTGTTVGQFLLIEPSARVSAMGNAGVTTFEEATATFYNPGAPGHLPGSDVQFTHSSWLAGITYNYATASVRFGEIHNLLLTVTALGSGEIDVRTVEQPLGTGERYTVEDLALGLGYSRRVTDRFSAGILVSYVQEKIWHSTMSAVGLNLGVLYQLPFGTYIGASLSNFGTRGRFDGRDLRIRYDQDPDRFGDNSNLPAALTTEEFPLPILFRVGLGMPVLLDRRNELHVVVDAFQPSDNTQSIGLGAEWTFMKTFSLRGGYQDLFQQDAETGLTLGAGLAFDISQFEARFDYAWNSYGRIGDVQRFTVGFAF
jgi:hypothetical protein